MMEQLREDAENYDNFLRPEMVKQIREDKINLLKTTLRGKKSNIWKPSKFEVPKDLRLLMQGLR
jgi:hypothetical protein